MKEGEIIAFRATGERRKPTSDEAVRYSDGDIYSGPSTLFGDILIPLTPAEIAQAERTLAAVEKHKGTLKLLADGNRNIWSSAASEMAKEILGS